MRCSFLFLSFTTRTASQLSKVGRRRQRKKEIRVSGRSVIQADVLSHSRADVVGTTLSIFSLHVGLFSARYLAHSSCSSDEEEAPCCRSGIGHCVAALCAMELGPVFPGIIVYTGTEVLSQSEGHGTPDDNHAIFFACLHNTQ